MHLAAGPHRIHVAEFGDGPTSALLLHSSGMSGRQWRRLAERLAPTHHVLVPDLVGYGASPAFEGDAFSCHEEADVVRAVARAAGRPVHLVGHSYGGLVALLAALAPDIEVASVSAYEPVAFGVLRSTGDEAGLADLRRTDRGGDFFAPELEGTAIWCERFVDFWGGDGAWARLAPPQREAFSASARKTFHEVRSCVLDETPHGAYAGLRAPALLLTGEASPVCARRVVAILAATLPHAEVVVVPGAGHMGPLTHAAVVDERIAAHIDAAAR
jgi:pimeloyl-ACP methyl ester carboxylesterase